MSLHSITRAVWITLGADYLIHRALYFRLYQKKGKVTKETCHAFTQSRLREAQSPPPLLGALLFSVKHPRDSLSFQNANWHPPSDRGGRGDFCVILYTCSLEVASPFLRGVHFRGCEFTFCRLRLLWGCVIETRGPLKRGGYFGFPRQIQQRSFQ